MSEEQKEKQPLEVPPGAKEIHPSGDYAIKGFVVLAILEDLQNSLPIVHTHVVERVEKLLATVNPIRIQKPAQQTSATIQEAPPTTPPPPAGATEDGLVEGGA